MFACLKLIGWCGNKIKNVHYGQYDIGVVYLTGWTQWYRSHSDRKSLLKEKKKTPQYGRKKYYLYIIKLIIKLNEFLCNQNVKCC